MRNGRHPPPYNPKGKRKDGSLARYVLMLCAVALCVIVYEASVPTGVNVGASRLRRAQAGETPAVATRDEPGRVEPQVVEPKMEEEKAITASIMPILPGDSIYRLSANDIDGHVVQLSRFAGQVRCIHSAPVTGTRQPTRCLRPSVASRVANPMVSGDSGCERGVPVRKDRRNLPPAVHVARTLR